jgi:hypothetical protein
VPSQRLRCITHLGEEGTPHKYGSLPHSEGRGFEGRGFEEDLVVRRVRTTHSAMVGEVRAALSRLRIRPYGSRLVHTPIALNILADMISLVPPLIQLEKGRLNFGASKKSSAGFPASAAATTRSKLSCGNLALIGSNPARA